jgi:hypothetical protein
MMLSCDGIAMARTLATSACLAVASIAWESSFAYAAFGYLALVPLFAAVDLWPDLRRLRRAAAAGRAGDRPLDRPSIERRLDEHRRSVPLDVTAIVLASTGVAVLVHLAIDDPVGRWLAFAGGACGGLGVSRAALLLWLRRWGRKDGMELFVRDDEHDPDEGVEMFLRVKRAG